MSPVESPNAAPPSLFQRLLGLAALTQSRGAKPSDWKRPTNLLYDVNETPPFLVALGAAVQHVFLMSVGWLYIVVLMNSAGATTGQTLNMIRISMIASGIATILQGQIKFFGSGYFPHEQSHIPSMFDTGASPPRIEEIGSQAGVIAMAGYLIRQYADRARIKSRQDRCLVQLHFEH